MLTKSLRVLPPVFAAAAMATYVFQPSASPPAQANLINNPVLQGRDFTAHQFAVEARRIGSLRHTNTNALVRRFTTDAREQAKDQTGQSTSAGVVNVNNWLLNPAGTQSDIGDFPVTALLSPDKSHLLVVNSGADTQSVQLVNTSDGSIAQTISYPAPSSAFIGAAFTPDGTKAYVAGGGQNVIHTFTVNADGTLKAGADITEAPAPSNPFSSSSFPAGMSASPDSKTLYVANTIANNVALVDTGTDTITTTIPVGYRPYMTLVNPSTGMVYVSNWGDGTVSVINPTTKTVINTIKVGQHPSNMLMGPLGMLLVSDSNSDTISVVDPVSQSEVRRVDVRGDPNLPIASSPEGMSVSPDGRTLYVADAGDNAISVFSVTPSLNFLMQGWIPTAWYPTDVVASPDGAKIWVTNGFGMGEHANGSGLYPDPTRTQLPPGYVYSPTYCHCSYDNFSGTMDMGTLSTIPVPSRGQLHNYTVQVAQNDHFFDASPLDRSSGNPVPVPGGTSPIKHVIYIVKENRTYDQVFGDMSVGKSDSTLALFPRSVTPNLHALADRFGLLDNFYADAQVSADGHNWTLSANASDYTEKTWPQDYSSPGRNFGYPFEGWGPEALSGGGYLWDAAAAAGISYRDYGLYALFDNFSTAKIIPSSQSCDGPTAKQYIGTAIPAGSVLCFTPTEVNPASTPNLVGHVDPKYLNYDMRYSDQERVAEWKREFDQFVTNNNLPALEFMRLSSDHTQGTSPGFWSPQRYASDNDAAVGQVVDAVSHSPYWSTTAIFVVEDDAQNGPDHVDSHRTEALVVSPYTSQSTPRAESTHYDTASMVRTIELLLGLKPLSQYDATATPMWQMFSATADTAPYTAIPQSVTTGSSTPQSFGARQSSQLNWALPDQAWAPAINRILWHAIKGARTPYPGAAPYGIPVPGTSHYVWGKMSEKTDPLLTFHGTPRTRILPSTSR